MSTPPTLGLRHLALFVPAARFEATVRFYTEGLGLGVDWQPDPDNVYLSSGPDNLALHRAAPERVVDHDRSPLDHLGFAMPSADDVRAWFGRLQPQQAALQFTIVSEVREHRDGATSFYLRDPAGHQVQLLHVPSLRP